MKDRARETLELFVEKAEKLKNEEFTQFIKKGGDHWSYHYTAEPQQLIMTTVATIDSN